MTKLGRVFTVCILCAVGAMLLPAQAPPNRAEVIRLLPLLTERPKGLVVLEAPDNPPPEYTPENAAVKARGYLMVTFTLDGRGVPTKVEAPGQVGPGFEREAKPSLLQWRLLPGMMGITSLPSTVTIRVNFKVPAKK